MDKVRKSYFAERVSFVLLLTLPTLLYLSITAFWQLHDLYIITGDEPHYLLVSDSMVRDHDLMVLNNYFIETPVHQEMPGDLPDQHVSGQYGVHGIGLPLLLAIPYYVAGTTGAKIF